MKLIDAVGLKIRLGKRYANDERRIREIFKETIDDMPTIEAIPIEWLLKWNKAQATRGLCNVKEMISDWRKENETNNI